MDKGLLEAQAVELLKSFIIGAALTWTIAIVVGSQGSTGGALAVHSLTVADFKFFWSWPLFLSGSGLAWGLMLLQK